MTSASAPGGEGRRPVSAPACPGSSGAAGGPRQPARSAYFRMPFLRLCLHGQFPVRLSVRPCSFAPIESAGGAGNLEFPSLGTTERPCSAHLWNVWREALGLESGTTPACARPRRGPCGPGVDPVCGGCFVNVSLSSVLVGLRRPKGRIVFFDSPSLPAPLFQASLLQSSVLSVPRSFTPPFVVGQSPPDRARAVPTIAWQFELRGGRRREGPFTGPLSPLFFTFTFFPECSRLARREQGAPPTRGVEINKVLPQQH